MLGGAKVSDKLGAITHLLEKVDAIFVGGAMAYTFLKATDHAIGRSLVEDDMIETARSLLSKAESAGKQIHLPTDHHVLRRLTRWITCVPANRYSSDLMGLDIGPETCRLKKKLSKAKTVVWNGLGRVRATTLRCGLRAVAEGIAESTRIMGRPSGVVRRLPPWRRLNCRIESVTSPREVPAEDAEGSSWKR